MARSQPVPNVPILMLLGDDQDDVYADTPRIKEWYGKTDNEKFFAIQCPKAKHELDNEIEPIGATVRHMIANFISNPSGPLVSNNTCNLIE